MIVDCQTQGEIDELWERLAEGGAPGRCGWLTDKFGVSWQITPSLVPEIMQSGDPQRIARAMAAIMPMTKLDIAKINAAVGSN